MKVLHVPFHYYPDAIGGTEVYVSSLSKELIEKGVEVEIAAPGHAGERYFHDGIRVHRFMVSERIDDVSELYGEGDEAAAEGFARILDETTPEVVHLHGLNRGISLRTLREAKKRGLGVAFTYHIPGITCARGTLLRYGREVCDGEWRLNTCSRCTLHSLGVPKPLSQVLGSLPTKVGETLGRRGPGRLWTALRMTHLQATRKRKLEAFIQEVDQIVAMSKWARDVLIRNGVPTEKITVSPHGISHPATHEEGAVEGAGSRRTAGSQTRIAFVGRLYPIKGVHILLQALRRQPALPLELDIFGFSQEEKGQAYERKLGKLAAGDERVRFHPPLPSRDVVNRLRDYDFLAVPSQWMETGPLVVLEAFAAGIPVIGSNLGGIADRVQHGRNGLLVETTDVRAWEQTLERVCREPELASLLRAGVRSPRDMSAVADEMISLYRRTAAAPLPATR